MGAIERCEYIDLNRNQHKFGQVIGQSPALEVVFENVGRVAPTNSTVLIQGETGTDMRLGQRLGAWKLQRIRPAAASTCSG